MIVLLVISLFVNLILALAYLRLRNLLNHDGVLRGKDAKRFVEAMNNPPRVSREEYLRAKSVYEAVQKNGLLSHGSLGGVGDGQ